VSVDPLAVTVEARVREVVLRALGAGSVPGTGAAAATTAAATSLATAPPGFQVPARTYFSTGALGQLVHLPRMRRVTVVTDKFMVQFGMVEKVLAVLRSRPEPVELQIIDTVEPEPTVAAAEAGARLMADHRPDTIIAVGGGSPLDAAKIMWLKYEHPDVPFAGLRDGTVPYPPLGAKAQLVCIPTSSGTGSEVSPYAVVTDPSTGRKYPLASFTMTPSIAIVDPVFTQTMPPRLAADSGLDALTHATEAFVSTRANAFADGLCLRAIKLIFENLEPSCLEGTNVPDHPGRRNMHDAATIAGMAFSNSCLGLVHAISHTVGAQFHLVHGRTNAVLLPYLIRYNGVAEPGRFQEIAEQLHLPHATAEQAIDAYAQACRDLATAVGVERCFAEQGVDKEEFISSLDLLAERTMADQCATTNPRVPTPHDLKDLMVAAYYGIPCEDVTARRLRGEDYRTMGPR